MNKFKTFLKEDPNRHLQHFLDHTSKELNLKTLPNIQLVNDRKAAAENRSFGGYSPGLKEIRVNTAGRHVADIYRTLAHELVHYKQDVEGRLSADNVAEAGKTGSEFENEANTLAGVILRNYGKANPKIYEDYENPFRFDWGTPEGTNYMVKMTPGQTLDPRSDYFAKRKKKLISK